MRTTHAEGFTIEHGPNTLLLNDARVAKLLDDLGLTDQLIKADHSSAKRFVIRGGKPIELPSSPKNLFGSKAISLRGKLRLLKEPFIKKSTALDDQSFADFVHHRLGQEMLDYAAGPFVNGIYAGDAGKLSFRHAFPRLYDLVNEHGSIIRGFIKLKKKTDPNRLATRDIISFKNGMQSISDGFVNKLPEGTIKTGISNIKASKLDGFWKNEYQNSAGEQQCEKFDRIIIAVPAHKLERINLPEGIQFPKTSSIPHPPVSSLLLGFKKEQVAHPLDGFGMLAGLPEKCSILGALFTSTLFQNRAPEGHVSINVMLGGARSPKFTVLDKEEITQIAMKELRKILGVTGDPVFSMLNTWTRAIPQVTQQHQEVLDELETIEKNHPGLQFIGNYRGGISVGDCLLNGQKTS